MSGIRFSLTQSGMDGIEEYIKVLIEQNRGITIDHELKAYNQGVVDTCERMLILLDITKVVGYGKISGEQHKTWRELIEGGKVNE